jgi:hypothetical protein
VHPDDALRQVTRRFLAAYSPATRDDYARRWGTSPADALRRIKERVQAVAQVEVEGAPGWMRAEHVEEAVKATPSRSVRLLPAFDPYVIGSTRHVTSLLPGPFKDRVHRSQGWVSRVLLVDGRMDGVWRHDRKGSRLEVRIEPLVKLLTWARRAAEDEAQRLAQFLGDTLELSWAS